MVRVRIPAGAYLYNAILVIFWMGNDELVAIFEKALYGQEIPRIACEEPIPISVMQGISNELFYKQEYSGLEYIGTLGSCDTLLAKAIASFEKKKGNHGSL